jgi:hypothetical protein
MDKKTHLKTKKNTELKKASDSDNADRKNHQSEEVFTQEKFEDALRRVSRPICEPDEETT